jgi:hypothetical protein
METPEKQSPTTLEYRSGTSQGLGAGWDVMHVIRRGKDHADSAVIARDAKGTIMRKTDSFPETWEIISDEETLRVCRERFDHRDRLAAEQGAGAGGKVEKE